MASTGSKRFNSRPRFRGPPIRDHFDFLELPEDEELTDVPGFAKLLQELTCRISPNGCSVLVEKRLENAKAKLKPFRHEYLRNRLLYDELTDLVLEFDVKAIDSSLDPAVAKFHKELKSSLATSEAQQTLLCLGADELGDAKYSGLMLELKISRQNLPAPKTLNSAIQKRLQEKLCEIVEFHASNSSSSKSTEQSHLYVDFPSVIQRKQFQVKLARRSLAKFQREVVRLYRKSLKILSQNCELLFRLARMLLSCDSLQVKELHILKTQTRVTALKIEVFGANLLSRTYSTDVVKAHRVIRTRLKSEATKLNAEKTRIQERLTSYENVDQDFPKLLDEYKNLKRRVDQLAWLENEGLGSKT